MFTLFNALPIIGQIASMFGAGQGGPGQTGGTGTNTGTNAGSTVGGFDPGTYLQGILGLQKDVSEIEINNARKAVQSARVGSEIQTQEERQAIARSAADAAHKTLGHELQTLDKIGF